MKIAQTKYETVPTGEYLAAIDKIEDSEGKFGPQLRFTFRILDGERQGATLSAWCSQKFSPRSKLYAWTRAAFRADIPPTYDFDSDDLLDRRVRLTIVVKEGDNGEYSKVEAVLPIKNGDLRPQPEPVSEDSKPVPF